MLNLAYVQEQIEMAKREEILKRHNYKIWIGNNKCYYTYLPDEEKGRRLIKRTTQRNLEDAIIKFYTEIENAEKAEQDSKETFEYRFKLWKKRQVEWGVSNNTLMKYDSDYIRYFEGTSFEKKDIKKITEDDITAVMVQKVKSLELNERAGKTMWNYISSIFKFSRRIVPDNPCVYVNKKVFTRLYSKKKKTAEERTISTEDAKKLLRQLRISYVEKPEYIQSYAVELAMYTGMRVGELAALKWDDVDFKQRILTISHSERYDRIEKKFYIDKTKNGEVRIFPLCDEIVTLLISVKKVELQYGFLGKYVFQNANGRIHARSISHCMRYKCKQAGIEPKGIHAIRRTLNSKVRCAGVSVTIASALFGHTESVNEHNYTYDISEMEYKRSVISKAIETLKIV